MKQRHSLFPLYSPYSAHFWTSCEHTGKLPIHKAKWGHLYSPRILACRNVILWADEPHPTQPPRATATTVWATRMGPATSLLAALKDCYIIRHDRAVKLFQAALTKGTIGNCLTFMDAGKYGTA